MMIVMNAEFPKSYNAQARSSERCRPSLLNKPVAATGATGTPSVEGDGGGGRGGLGGLGSDCGLGSTGAIFLVYDDSPPFGKLTDRFLFAFLTQTSAARPKV